MRKLPGSKISLDRLQMLLPLGVYLLATLVLLWSAFLFATSAVIPLAHPQPLDVSTVLRHQEQVNQAQFTTATEHFPESPSSPKPSSNPFGR